MGRLPRFHESTTYFSGTVIHYGLRSCEFQLRGKRPASGDIERIRLIEYFPAFQQISDQCLETPEDYSGGRTDVGNQFFATLGADRLFEVVRNATVGSGGTNDETVSITA